MNWTIDQRDLCVDCKILMTPEQQRSPNTVLCKLDFHVNGSLGYAIMASQLSSPYYACCQDGMIFPKTRQVACCESCWNVFCLRARISYCILWCDTGHEEAKSMGPHHKYQQHVRASSCWCSSFVLWSHQICCQRSHWGLETRSKQSGSASSQHILICICSCVRFRFKPYWAIFLIFKRVLSRFKDQNPGRSGKVM